MLDSLAANGWSCGWHTVQDENGQQQVVIEGHRKNVTLVWRWEVNTKDAVSEPSGSISHD